MKVVGIISGTFDPFTYGHMNLVTEADSLYDEVHIIISEHPKKKPLYSLESRLKMLADSTYGLNVKVASLVGENIIEHLRQIPRNFNDRFVILRGIRNVTDYLYEKKIYKWCKRIAHERWIQYGFIMSPSSIEHVSSSQIKQWGAEENWDEVAKCVPPAVFDHMKEYKYLLRPQTIYGGTSPSHSGHHIEMVDHGGPSVPAVDRPVWHGKMPDYFKAAVKNGLFQISDQIAGDQVREMLDPVPYVMVLSEVFHLKTIEIGCVKPTGNRYLPHSQSLGPIIVEANCGELAEKHPRAAALGPVIIIEGKHRWLDAKDRGELTIQAWVGDKALPHVKIAEGY